MPYDNDYNKGLSKDIDALNRNFVLNEDVTLNRPAMARFSGSGDQKLEGGFLGAIASAVLPMILSGLAGKGKSGGCECESMDSKSVGEEESPKEMEEEPKKEPEMKGGAVYNSMRDKMEGKGKASMKYKKQSEDKYMCGLGRSGGSAFGAKEGTVRDTGVGKTVPQNIQLKKKRGRKSKMAPIEKVQKIEGSGIISDLGIPIVSNIAGMFGLGASGGARGNENPLPPETFYPKRVGKTAVSASKKGPSDLKLKEKSQMPGSKMSGMGKKPSAWLELVKKVRDEHKELKGVKAITEYIKKNGLYKK